MMFALVDCNNFYASCERAFNPKWNNQPIVILSNNDGCIIARSNEAKALGIPMGAPHFKYREFMQAHGVIVCSSNYTLYGDMSSRVMRTLKMFTPDMQIYSIDEAFLALQGNNIKDQGDKIRNTVLKWTGIPVSIGIAPTKTLSKIANHFAKKNNETGGVYTLDTQEKIDTILDQLPVTEIWGIGNQLGKKLNRNGIMTAKDFRDADDSLIRKHLTIVGLRCAMELRGISCLPLQEIPSQKKSITNSRAFGKPIDNINELSEAVATYTATAAEKMRSQRSLASQMTVFVELHPFNRDSPNSFHVKVIFSEPTDFTPRLIEYAKTSLSQLFTEGNSYRKVGITLDALVPNHCFQQDLFSPKASPIKQQKLMQTIDRLNQNYGRNIIHTAAEGINNSWKMKQDKKTPCFTTRWEDLLKIKI